MRLLINLTLLLTLTACGGGDDNTDAVQQCSASDINSQIFCAMQQDYLWYKQLPETINPANYSTPAALVEAVVAPQDRYSFVLTRQQYEDRFINATFFGYGFSTVPVDNDTALQVAFVYDDGSAAQNGLRRGDKIIEIEGISVASWLQQLEAGTVTSEDIYGPNEDGVMRNFVWVKPDGSELQSDFIKGDVTTNTVLHRSVTVQNGKKVGYLVFNSFIELSEAELEQAFAFFKAEQIEELILDVRYNGGGLIRVANQLSTQIAQQWVQGKVFVTYQYNDKNSAKNTSTLFALGKGQSVLNLNRLFVLTSERSCSSSELVINSLAPFIDVVQIGDATCGKPVGQQPDIIGDYVLFAVNFQTVNALNQGDYFTGLQPECVVDEQIMGDWGVANDPFYAEALNYIASGSCSDVAVGSASLRQVTQTKLTAPWTVNNEQ